MQRSLRLQQCLKWTGLIMSLVLLVAWLGSGFAQIQWTNSQGNVSWGLSGGRVSYSHNIPSLPIQSRGVSVEIRRVTVKFSWDAAGYPRITSFSLPVWPLLSVIAVSTAIAWVIGSMFSKRRFEGSCANCGYDIRGLEVCPECAVGVKR